MSLNAYELQGVETSSKLTVLSRVSRDEMAISTAISGYVFEILSSMDSSSVMMKGLDARSIDLELATFLKSG